MSGDNLTDIILKIVRDSWDNPRRFTCADGFCGDLDTCNTCRRVAGLPQITKPNHSFEDTCEPNDV